MSNVERVEAELAALPGAPPGLAQAALTMAAGLDEREPSLAMKALATRELRETMLRIRELAPPEQRKDFVDNIQDEVAKARAKRTKGKPGVRRSAPEAEQSS